MNSFNVFTTNQRHLSHSDLEAFQGSVVGVEQHHGQGGQLRRAIPTVAAVHDHRGLVVLNLEKFYKQWYGGRRKPEWWKLFVKEYPTLTSPTTLADKM